MKLKKTTNNKPTKTKTDSKKIKADVVVREILRRQAKNKQAEDSSVKLLSKLVKNTGTVKCNRNKEENTVAIDKNDNIEKKEEDFKDIVKVLSYVFPLHINKEDIIIDEDPVRDVKSLNGREISFTAKYKQVDVLCVRIIVYGDITFHQAQYYYAYDMSQRLIACRNMASYFAIFECNKLEDVNFIKAPPKNPALLLMKPLYSNGNLQQYLVQVKKSGVDQIPHTHMLQMAISLFSMLSDAHAQNIGLVNINADNIFIGDDYGLYFDGFDSCIPFDESDAVHSKFWIDLNMLKCPENYKAKNFKYLASTDVYLATILLIELAKNYKFMRKPYVVDKGKQEVTLIREAVHSDHCMMIDIIDKGLKYNPDDRATASSMLDELEKARMRYLGSAVL